MAKTNFIRFFNKLGEDCNFTSFNSTFGKTFEGSLYFPRVSTNLIESENLYILEEVTLPTTTPNRTRLSGTAILVSGTPFVTIVDGAPTSELVEQEKIVIDNVQYTVQSVSLNSIEVSPTPAVSGNSTNIYRLDYIAYNAPLKSNVITESIVAEFVDETGEFFFYDIDYTDDLPLINKTRTQEIVLTQANEGIDITTGRSLITGVNHKVKPVDFNIGFSSIVEGNFVESINVFLKKTLHFTSSAWTYLEGDDKTYTITIDANSIYADYVDEIKATDAISLSRSINGATQYFGLIFISFEQVTISGAEYFLLTVKEPNTNMLHTVTENNLETFGFSITWKEELASIGLYGEAESEDERFKLVLENFGRKIDQEKEYIFRDSDINEELTDNILLNKKRKELLLEGDKIYPYMGSYKALINVLNLFGYYDVDIKEYFLNVDQNSPDKGKFTSVIIDKKPNSESVKRTWAVLPSSVYKKTSLFGLYYKLNKTTGAYDEFDMPIVEEDYQFTADEVLIKLFGLKELLKKDYLPLNARIYDITGEGIYFEKYSLPTWSDDTTIRTINLGTLPDIYVYPEHEAIIKDIRVIDEYYIDKFTDQGLTGFYNSNMLLHNWEHKREYQDSIWENMPPGLVDINFNTNMSYTNPLADDTDIVIGAPILLEVIFKLEWKECFFAWNDLNTSNADDLVEIIDGGDSLTEVDTIVDGGVSDTPYFANTIDGGESADMDNIDLWTWDTLSRCDYVDMRIIVDHSVPGTFHFDTDRRPMQEFEFVYTNIDGQSYKRLVYPINLPFSGIYNIYIYVYDALNGFTMQFLEKTVNTANAQITTSHQDVNTVTTWDNMDINWESLSIDNLETGVPETAQTNLTVEYIDRRNSQVIVTNEQEVNKGDFLFFSRLSSTLELTNLACPNAAFTELSYDTVVYNNFGHPSLHNLPLYAKIMIKNASGPYYEMGTGDFCYGDIIAQTSTETHIKIQGEFDKIQTGHSTLFVDSGFYSGTYAIEIKGSSVAGGKTTIFLNDSQKELYKLDNLFSVYLAPYDIDYAETHIGKVSEIFDNSVNSWNDYSGNDWISRELHSVENPGFIIPSVHAGTTITINDFDTFTFSDNPVLNNGDTSSLVAAIQELNNADNEGIERYDYTLFPSEKIYIRDINGVILTPVSNTSNTVTLSGVPNNTLDVANIWSGNEWLTIVNIEDNVITVNYINDPVTEALLPYNWHTQLIIVMRQFYDCILATSKTDSLDMFDQIIIDDNFTTSYAMGNAELFKALGKTDNNVQLKYKEYNNDNFFENDIATMHTEYTGAFTEVFSIRDLSVSNNSITINQNTLVTFHDDTTRVPAKQSWNWKLFNDKDIELVSVSSKKMTWKFEKSGLYNIQLTVVDKNGNISETIKKSFINVL